MASEDTFNYAQRERQPDESSSMLDMDDTEDEGEAETAEEEITARQAAPVPTTAPLNLALRPAADPQQHGWAATSFAASLFRNANGPRIQTVRDAPVVVMQPREVPSQASMRAETVFESAASSTPERSISAASSWLNFEGSPSVSPVAPFFLDPSYRQRVPHDEAVERVRDRDSFLDTDNSPERDLREQWAERRSFIDDDDSEMGTPVGYRLHFNLAEAPPVPTNTLAPPTEVASLHLSTDSAGQLLSSDSGGGGGLRVVSGSSHGMAARDSTSNLSVGSSLRDRLSHFPEPPSPTASRTTRATRSSLPAPPERPTFRSRRSRSLPQLPSLPGSQRASAVTEDRRSGTGDDSTDFLEVRYSSPIYRSLLTPAVSV
jgi:hypothetical protein